MFDLEKRSSTEKSRDGGTEKETENQATPSVSSSQAPSSSVPPNSSQQTEKTDPNKTGDASMDAPTLDAKRAELEKELAGLTLTPDVKTVLRRHVSDSGPQDGMAAGGADLLVTAPARAQANSCPSELETDSAKEGGTGSHRLLTADDEQTQSLTPTRASIYALRHSLRRRANTLGGTLVQGAQAVGTGVGTLGGTLVQGKG